MIELPFGQGYWKEHETSIEATSRPEGRGKKYSLAMHQTDARLPAMRPGAFDAARSPSPTPGPYVPMTAGKVTRVNYNKLGPATNSLCNSYGQAQRLSH